MVLIRTGHGRLWMKDNDAYGDGEPGIGMAAAQVAVRAEDRPGRLRHLGHRGRAARGPGPAVPGAPVVLVRHGIYNLENLDLEELARDKVYEFAFIFAPLRLKGATGSPGNPIAVR